jgi:collagen type I alpha
MTIIVSSGSTFTVTNTSSLVISGSDTIAATGVVHGEGSIVGTGSLLNLGTITSDQTAGVLAVNSATLTNQGTVFANNASLAIQSGVDLTNLASGTLTAGVWESAGTGTLAFLEGSIVTDAATIILNGTASAMQSGTGTLRTIDNSLTTVASSGKLELLGGRSFSAVSSLVVNGTVTLGGGTLAAPVGGIAIAAGGIVVGFGTIDSGTAVTDNGKVEANGGTLSVPALTNLQGSGTLQVDAGASLVLSAFGGAYQETVVNNGTIDVAYGGLGSGTLAMTGPYSGTGGFLIQGGFDGADRTILELPDGVSGNVAFDPNFGELLLDDVATFNGSLSTFGNNDTLVLQGISNAVSATVSGNSLKLTNSLGATVETISFLTNTMNYGSAVFSVVENAGSTAATVTMTGAVACFAAGTRIKTWAGEVPVEDLAAGDVVRARFAGTAPVVWIGHRHVDCRRHTQPLEVWPVRISAHAFGPRMPHRDLLLSPDHSVYFDNVLIPVKHLINGHTVVQEPIDTIIYYHVELGDHDVLLAEGMPVESYLEDGARSAFENADGVIALQPEFVRRQREAFGCAPLVVTGPKLAAVAALLRSRLPKGKRAVTTWQKFA